MIETAIVFLLIHSPLVGPMTWEPVSEELRESGYKVIVPELRSPPGVDGLYWERHADAILKATAGLPHGNRIIMVGHSGAGPLLPALREKLPHSVAAYIFVHLVLLAGTMIQFPRPDVFLTGR